MTQNKNLSDALKSIPIVGGVARFARKALDKTGSGNFKQQKLRARHFISWHFGSNPKSRRLFNRYDSKLTPNQQEFVESMKSVGIAVTTVEKSGLSPENWEKLRTIVENFSSKSIKLLSSATKQNVDRLDYGDLIHNKDRFRRFFRDQTEARSDDYIIKMNPENSIFPPDHPLVTVGLSPAVLNVVNSYLGLLSKMVYADAWHSIPLDPGIRIGSQRWHRDPEDFKMVKVYLYVSNVVEDSGPMEYIPGTSNAAHASSIKIAKWMAAGASLYPPAEVIDQCFAPSARMSCTGPKGTLVFCDTTGIHRGGIPRADSRVLATWTFVTPAALKKHRFSVNPTGGRAISKEALFALS